MMDDVGLIYRRAFPIDMGRVVIEEKWDLDHPGCRLIPNPWINPMQSMNTRQIIMTQQEYEDVRPVLFERDVTATTSHKPPQQ